jgi:hypothetical protein
MATHRWIVLTLVLATIPAVSLRAQTVRGTLVDEETQAAVSGAVILLLDAGDDQRGGTLTDENGRFTVQVPGPGAYRLRAERIGYQSITSPLLRLVAGETREVTLAAPAQGISLQGITVVAEQRCVIRPQDGVELTRVWDEARKALTATVLAEGSLRYNVVQYERELEPGDLRVRSERRVERSALASLPFASVPVEELSEYGYVRYSGDEATYYAPDARVLLSDAFLETHCFRLRKGTDARTGLIGLAFEPVRERDLPDVQGVLWLVPATAELREMEYRYTGLDPSIPVEQIGGDVEFEQLPSGLWIVSRWYIRMPITGIRRAPTTARGVLERLRNDPGSLVAIREEGGEVLGAYRPGGQRLAQDRPHARAAAALAGVVFDSMRAVPLAAATVYLAGTQHSATTDEEGRFRLEGIPEGAYSVGFLHPELEALGYLPALREVEIQPGQTADIELAAPSYSRVLNQVCGDQAVDGDGLIVGQVRTAGTGAPVPEAEIVAQWADIRIGSSEISKRERSLRMQSDRRGYYRLCGLPEDATVRLGVRADDRAEAWTAVVTPRNRPAYQDLRVGVGGRDGGLTGAAGDADRAPAILGTVTEAGTGQPLVNAQLAVRGTGRGTLTDAQGRFRLDDVPAGRHTLEVRHLGYAPAEVAVELAEGRTVQLEVSLGVRPVELAGVIAEAEISRVRAGGFYRRMERREGGYFVDREVLEQPGVHRTVDALRGVPGLKLSCLASRCTAYFNRAAPVLAGRDIGKCPIQYYVDGAPFELGPMGLEEFRPADIEGIEVYAGAGSVPAQFGGSRSRCGVIAIWTRSR